MGSRRDGFLALRYWGLIGRIISAGEGSIATFPKEPKWLYLADVMKCKFFCPCPSLIPSFWLPCTGLGTISSRKPALPLLSIALFFAAMTGTWQNTLKLYFLCLILLYCFLLKDRGQRLCKQGQGGCLLKNFLIVDRCFPVLPSPSLCPPPPRGSVSYSLNFFLSYSFLLLGLNTELFPYLSCFV